MYRIFKMTALKRVRLHDCSATSVLKEGAHITATCPHFELLRLTFWTKHPPRETAADQPVQPAGERGRVKLTGSVASTHFYCTAFPVKHELQPQRRLKCSVRVIYSA